MGFKINLLFLLVVFNMFSMGHLCSSKPAPPPPYNPPSYCNLKHDPGPCMLNMSYNIHKFLWRFGFLKLNGTNTCQAFGYWGCGGNDNNFETYEECMKTCSDPNFKLNYKYENL